MLSQHTLIWCLSKKERNKSSNQEDIILHCDSEVPLKVFILHILIFQILVRVLFSQLGKKKNPNNIIFSAWKFTVEMLCEAKSIVH